MAANLEKGSFNILWHHWQKLHITAEVFSDRSPEQLAEEWIEGIDRNPHYETRFDYEARKAMKEAYTQHIRDIRAGKVPKFVDDQPGTDPICAKCRRVTCPDSRVNRKD